MVKRETHLIPWWHRFRKMSQNGVFSFFWRSISFSTGLVGSFWSLTEPSNEKTRNFPNNQEIPRENHSFPSVACHGFRQKASLLLVNRLNFTLTWASLTFLRRSRIGFLFFCEFLDDVDFSVFEDDWVVFLGSLVPHDGAEGNQICFLLEGGTAEKIKGKSYFKGSFPLVLTLEKGWVWKRRRAFSKRNFQSSSSSLISFCKNPKISSLVSSSWNWRRPSRCSKMTCLSQNVLPSLQRHKQTLVKTWKN